MASIYQITNDIAFISELMEEGEVDLEALKGALEVSEEELAIKLENYCKFIKNLESDNNGLKAEEERLAARRKKNESTIDRMKKAMIFALNQVGKPKILCGSFTVSVQKSKPSVILDCEPSFIPEAYFVPQEPKLDKNKIAEDLNLGIDLSGIAHLEQGDSIKIK